MKSEERTQWFRDAKFGLFIHWGAYSVIGRHEQARNRLRIPKDEYDKYVRRFNPVNYDPEEWVRLAEDAGIKYIVITSKHHDGFCIFHSETTDYDMRITPYDGDLLKMLMDSCSAAEIPLGFYYSIMDWQHPDYIPKRRYGDELPDDTGDLDAYIDFMKEQLRELLTRYGDLACVWFDGEWEHTIEEMRSDEVREFILSLQPNTLINDRLYKRQPGNPADFGTPEQCVPATGAVDEKGNPILWEACMTINEDSWGYNKYETIFKTERDLIRKLIEVVSKGGNLLLNVGPKPDGTIQEEFVSRLRAMGKWLDVNGEAIYGTSASCFPRVPFFGRCTTKGSIIYAHVFQWPKGGELRLPRLGNEVQNISLLSEPESKLNWKMDERCMVIELPENPPDETASVVKIELDGEPLPSDYVIMPDDDGTIRLPAEESELQTGFGQRAKYENLMDHVFVTNWLREKDVPSWTFETPSAAKYKVTVSYAAGGKELAGMGEMEQGNAAILNVKIGDSELQSKLGGSGGPYVFKTVDVGEVELDSGSHELQAVLTLGPNGETINLENVLLTHCP